MSVVRSVPVEMAGKDYELRFEQPDVIALEDDLKIGYVFLFRMEQGVPVYLSLKLVRALIHRGLKVRDDRGKFRYAFPQGPKGADEAGAVIEQYISDGGKIVDLWKNCYDAFAGWFGESKESGESGEGQDGDEKNSP